MNSDFRELLSIFEKHQVRYMVAGGYAVEAQKQLGVSLEGIVG